MESREDPRDLPGSTEGVRRQQAAAQTGDRLCEIVVSVNGITNSWQSEFRNVLLVQVEEQETATIPRRDLGRRHEDVVAIRRWLRVARLNAGGIQDVAINRKAC